MVFIATTHEYEAGLEKIIISRTPYFSAFRYFNRINFWEINFANFCLFR